MNSLERLSGEMPAFAERQPGEQVQGNRRKAQPASDARQHREPDSRGANFDENPGDIVNRLRQRVPLVRNRMGKAGFESWAE